MENNIQVGDVLKSPVGQVQWLVIEVSEDCLEMVEVISVTGNENWVAGLCYFNSGYSECTKIPYEGSYFERSNSIIGQMSKIATEHKGSWYDAFEKTINILNKLDGITDGI